MRWYSRSAASPAVPCCPAASRRVRSRRPLHRLSGRSEAPSFTRRTVSCEVVVALDTAADFVEVGEEAGARWAGLAEAAGGTAVTGRAVRVRLHEERVVVAIDLDADEVQEILRRLTLGPQALPGRLKNVTFFVRTVFFSAAASM